MNSKPTSKLFDSLDIPLSIVGFIVSLVLIAFFTPEEATMGIVQKIFYFHVPSAYAMYLSWAICAAASFLYLGQQRDKYDQLAVSAAEVALVFALMVMISGPLWGRKSWGAYWVWDPRLTSALVLTLIIGSYVLSRHMDTAGVLKKFSSVLALIGVFMIPFIHLSVSLWRGQHPDVEMTQMQPAMLRTFAVSMVSFTIICLTFIRRRLSLEQKRSALNDTASHPRKKERPEQ